MTRRQAVESGLTSHAIDRLTAESWTTLARGVYHLGGGEAPWVSLARAGVIIGGEEARLGHTSAGFLHGLIEREPLPINVLTPTTASIVRSGPWRFSRERSGVRGPSVGSLPRTGIDDTVLDLCAGGGAADVVDWLTLAVQKQRTTPERLRWALECRSRHPHRQLIHDIVAEVAEGVQSPLEHTYLGDVERAHGLPKGRRQTRSRKGPYFRDIYYDEFQLLVELDGRLGHEALGRFRDMWRDNVHVIEGQSTLRYGWHDVAGRGCAVAAQVGLVLGRRGWDGEIVRCPQCPELNRMIV